MGRRDGLQASRFSGAEPGPKDDRGPGRPLPGASRGGSTEGKVPHAKIVQDGRVKGIEEVCLVGHSVWWTIPSAVLHLHVCDRKEGRGENAALGRQSIVSLQTRFCRLVHAEDFLHKGGVKPCQHVKKERTAAGLFLNLACPFWSPPPHFPPRWAPRVSLLSSLVGPFVFFSFYFSFSSLCR